jgi:hypothetical protein
MSQDSEVCVKCGTPCGYDDDKAYFNPGYICGRCKGNLVSKFVAFFGLDGVSSDTNTIDIDWRDADKILSHIKRDSSMRISYITTDKDLYERTTKIKTPIEG